MFSLVLSKPEADGWAGFDQDFPLFWFVGQPHAEFFVDLGFRCSVRLLQYTDEINHLAHKCSDLVFGQRQAVRPRLAEDRIRALTIDLYFGHPFGDNGLFRFSWGRIDPAVPLKRPPDAHKGAPMLMCEEQQKKRLCAPRS